MDQRSPEFSKLDTPGDQGESRILAHDAQAVAGARSRVQAYSFFRAGQVVEEQVQAIGLLNDVFSRNLTHQLSLLLRSKVEIELMSTEQRIFSDFAMGLPELSFVCSIRLDPLRAVSVLHLDMVLVPPMIDLLLGGEGLPGKLRELTEIEEAILAGVVETICRELTLAWQPVGLTFGMEKRQSHTQVPHLLPPAERALCLSFEVRMPYARGKLELAIPSVVFRTILRRLTGDRTRKRRHAMQTRERIWQRAALLPFGSTLQLCPVKISMRDLEQMEPGKTLLLPIPANTHPQLTIGGKALFSAQAVRQGEFRGAHLLAPMNSEAV